MNVHPEWHVRLTLRRIGFLIIALTFSFTLAIVQLVLGGDTLPCLMLAGATFFGLLAAAEAGFATAIGILNFILLSRFLLGAFVAKNLLLEQPITAGLLAPESTSAAMLLGFAGVWLGTLLVGRLVKPLPWFETSSQPSRLLGLFLVIFVGGMLSAIAVRVVGGDGLEGTTTGGFWGIAKTLGLMRNVSLPILMLYLWRTGSRRWLTHPAVISVTCLLFAIGVISVSKQSMAEPVLFYIFMAIARYGWRHPAGWVFVPLALLAFQFFIYPISQYTRYAGGSYKDAREAALATVDIVAGYVTDSSFRDYVQQRARATEHREDGLAYLPEDLSYMGRFAMIGPADRLVDSTDLFQLTKWDTIATSFLIAVPHFLYPNKPQLGAGNFLARYAGDLPATDYTTMVSYGFIANAYNAFGSFWVLPLTVLTILLVMVPISLIAHGPVYANPWSILAVFSVQQTYVESSFSGLFGSILMVAMALLVLFASRFMESVVEQASSRMSWKAPS